MRPVGTEIDLGLAADRGDAQLAGALQQQVEGEVQALALMHVGHRHRQRRMHAGTEQRVGAAGLERQLALALLQHQVVLDAADIADADADERLAEAIVAQVLGHAEVGGQLEVAGEVTVAVEQARLVDAARAQLGSDVAADAETLRQEVQAPADFAFLEIALAGLVVGFPLAHGLAVGHHQQRADDLLAVTGTARDVFQHAVAQALALLDHAVDHQDRDHQQQYQRSNGAELDQQVAIHWDSPWVGPWGESRRRPWRRRARDVESVWSLCELSRRGCTAPAAGSGWPGRRWSA